MEGLEPRLLLAGLPVLGELWDAAQAVDVQAAQSVVVSGSVDGLAEGAVYSLTTPARGQILLSASATEGGEDPLLIVFNERGRWVARSDRRSRWTDGNSIRLFGREGTRYYVLASSRDGQAVDYELRLSSNPVDDYGNDFADAGGRWGGRGASVWARGTINYGPDVDMMELLPAQTGVMAVAMKATRRVAGVGCTLEAYDAEGNRLAATVSQGPGATVEITFDVTEGETYYLRAASHDGNTGAYRITARILGFDALSPFGEASNPTGSPVGGGVGYADIIRQGDYLVQNAEEFLAALGRAQAGQVVYVAEWARVDLTGYRNIIIPQGVTLASNRGYRGSRGALIFTDELDTRPLFRTGGNGVRVTGLRLRGPDPDQRTEQMQRLLAEGGSEAYYSIPNSCGIGSTHADLEVDNCELSGWSHAAVILWPGATRGHIHHNYIHHNQRYGLGYGVALNQADALIEANLFNWNRHSISGTGVPGTSYEARYNVVLGDASSHSFDMHGGANRGDGTNIAGTLILIHHNIFRVLSTQSVLIRGVPLEPSRIYENWCLNANAAATIAQAYATGNLDVYDNCFGLDPA